MALKDNHYPIENTATVRKLLLDAIGKAADKPRSTGLVLADPKEAAAARARLKSMRRTPRRDP